MEAMEDQQEWERDTPLIYGRHPVVEALTAGTSIERIWFQQGLRGELEKEIRHLCHDRKIPLSLVPRERMQRQVAGNHQGVIAFTAAVTYRRLEEILPDILQRKNDPVLVVLDGVTDVRNMGAIARSAEVLGADGLITGVQGSAAVKGEAIKASAGALSRLPLCREQSLARTITCLQEHDFRVLAADAGGERAIAACNWEGPIALLFGGEDRGIHPALLRAADTSFRIPQTGKLNSLNVSVAAGIVLYELWRQRQA